ncbi:lipoprotein [Lysinibacillus sp. NPDC097287]|uniref:lipoprotein n=1 Tax=Lysinibacillus sp. NPDC097287 TaxID=3364144 RepID=UPI00381578B2
MKKITLLLLILIVLAACNTAKQEIHYVAKSEHWKAVYHSNTDDGLQLIYLDDIEEAGDIQINIEGKEDSLDISHARVNKKGKIIIKKKDVEKIFNQDPLPIIHIKRQEQDETLVVQ